MPSDIRIPGPWMIGYELAGHLLTPVDPFYVTEEAARQDAETFNANGRLGHSNWHELKVWHVPSLIVSLDFHVPGKGVPTGQLIRELLGLLTDVHADLTKRPVGERNNAIVSRLADALDKAKSGGWVR